MYKAVGGSICCHSDEIVEAFPLYKNLVRPKAPTSPLAIGSLWKLPARPSLGSNTAGEAKITV
ncbi:hypothetical protein ACQQ5V_00930 [Synechocystis sp. PCC 6803]|uniref:hypothetical protein n=1 Tax=Synechocystis sp. PCC 6803 TaxID=1148 RepID=UPI00030E31F6|nr:hypothetical protein [Synechocystis sp. PCC 6803]